tara:strand:- start:8032 stop:8997 length:966 start_codon:yes stop_codon:yes gene_type:complete
MKRNMKYFPLVLFVLFFSCTSEKKVKEEILAVPVKVKIDRFDEKFAAVTPANLQELKGEFPFLFPIQFHDSIWIQKTKDTLQKELENEVSKVFSDFSNYEAELILLYQHLNYYFSDFKEPTIITLISDVDYRNRVVATDSLVLVGLDNFLGSNHYFYDEIQRYIAKNLRPKQLTPSIAEALIEPYITPPKTRTFIDLMVYYGKLVYLKEQVLPLFDTSEIMGYTLEEMDWARANEAEIWRYFVERELLYSTDPKLASRFILPAPFSKFYLELDNESPGMLGQYMGWQIVKAFAQNNDIDLKQLLALSGDEIYKNSKFKPRK